jgi:hypothetical protein
MFTPRSALSDALQEAGAEVLLAPAPFTAAARLVIGVAPLAGWIVRSVRELDTLDRERAGAGFLDGITLWCMGGELAKLARNRNWTGVAAFGDASEVIGGASLWLARSRSRE